VTYTTAVRCRNAGISKFTSRNDPGHFGSLKGQPPTRAYADVAASALAPELNVEDRELTPRAKSSTGVLSSRVNWISSRLASSSNGYFVAPTDLRRCPAFKGQLLCSCHRAKFVRTSADDLLGDRSARKLLSSRKQRCRGRSATPVVSGDYQIVSTRFMIDF
jgi:hypothetical protein